MRALRISLIAAALLMSRFAGLAANTTAKVEYVPVEPNVKLEVLDWGGAGRALVLLTGLGGTAPDFDQFAQKLIASYHVYGITRRGSGNSDTPELVVANYTADRLGDDVLAVCAYLKLDRPVLVGHSIAGEEMSSIAARHPEKVAGLVYLDAGYGYALYDPVHGDFFMDLFDLEKKLAALDPRTAVDDIRPVLAELEKTSLPRFEQDVAALSMTLRRMGAPPPPPHQGPPDSSPQAHNLVLAGMQKFSRIDAPVLAFFAAPHDGRVNADQETQRQVAAFEAAVPAAHVVRLPGATHALYRSNEADVLREMKLFTDRLPR